MPDHANEFNELWERFHQRRELAHLYIEFGAFSRAAELFEEVATILRTISEKRLAYVRGIAE